MSLSPSPKVQQDLKEFKQKMIERDNAMKNQPIPQLQPSLCYDLFVDYMKCHKHVSNVKKQSHGILKLHEPDLKLTSVCNKAYKIYDRCTNQNIKSVLLVSDDDIKDDSIMKKKYNKSLAVHFMKDFEYYHTNTLTKQQQVDVAVQFLFDPSLNEKLQIEKNSMTYTEDDMKNYKQFLREQYKKFFEKGKEK